MQDREPPAGDTQADTAESEDAPPRPPEVMACLRVVGILFMFLLVPAVVWRCVFHYFAFEPFSSDQIVPGLVVAALFAFGTVGWQFALERRWPRGASVVRVVGGAFGFLPTLVALSLDGNDWVETRDLALWHPLATFAIFVFLVSPVVIGWLGLVRRSREWRGVAWSQERRRRFVSWLLVLCFLFVGASVGGTVLYLRDEAPPDVEDILAAFAALDEDGDLSGSELEPDVESSTSDVSLEDASRRIALERRLFERGGDASLLSGGLEREDADRRFVALLHRRRRGRRELVASRETIANERVTARSFAAALAFEYRRLDTLISKVARSRQTNERDMPPLLARWREGTTLRPNATRRLAAEWIRELLREGEKPRSQRGPSPARAALDERLRAINRTYFGHIMLGFWMRKVGPLWVPGDATVLALWDQLRCRDALLDTLLAVLLHEQDHGELPATLADLVPAYAAEAPADPYTGGPLRYDREARLIYSLGPAGIDAGPSEETDPAAALLDEYFPTARIP